MIRNVTAEERAAELSWVHPPFCDDDTRAAIYKAQEYRENHWLGPVYLIQALFHSLKFAIYVNIPKTLINLTCSILTFDPEAFFDSLKRGVLDEWYSIVFITYVVVSITFTFVFPEMFINQLPHDPPATYEFLEMRLKEEQQKIADQVGVAIQGGATAMDALSTQVATVLQDLIKKNRELATQNEGLRVSALRWCEEIARYQTFFQHRRPLQLEAGPSGQEMDTRHILQEQERAMREHLDQRNRSLHELHNRFGTTLDELHSYIYEKSSEPRSLSKIAEMVNALEKINVELGAFVVD